MSLSRKPYRLISLIGINSLEILAHGVCTKIDSSSIIVPAIDARREEVYAMVLDGEGTILESTVSIVLNESNILNSTYGDKTIHTIGNGASKVAQHILNRSIVHGEKAEASFMSQVSYKRYTNRSFDDIISFSPYYHKSPNIILSKKNVL